MMEQQGAFKVIRHTESKWTSQGTLEDRLNKLRADHFILSVSVLNYETKSNDENHGHGIDVTAQYLIIAHELSNVPG